MRIVDSLSGNLLSHVNRYDEYRIYIHELHCLTTFSNSSTHRLCRYIIRNINVHTQHLHAQEFARSAQQPVVAYMYVIAEYLRIHRFIVFNLK